MKFLIFAFIAVTCGVAYADAPSTSCPSGFVEIVEEHMTLANSSCPTGYTSAGTAASCLVSSPSGSCMMYAPAATAYNDTTGSYQYTEICPLS